MHETERKARRNSIVFLIVSTGVLLSGGVPMLWAWARASANNSPFAALGIAFFLYFFIFATYFSIVFAAISFKCACVAVRECMHDIPCPSSKKAKIFSLSFLILDSVIGTALLFMIITVRII